MTSDSIQREATSIGSVSSEGRHMKQFSNHFLQTAQKRQLTVFVFAAILYQKPHFWNLQRYRSLRHDAMLTRTFSTADFTNCQCKAILNTMYSQMMEHCNGAGYLEKLNDCMVEYAYLCILSFNIPQAMKVLEEALNFVKVRFEVLRFQFENLFCFRRNR